MYRKEKQYQILCNGIMAVVAILTIIPLILLFIASVTANQDITLYGYSFFPKHLSLEALCIYLE